jgi:glyoxylase-like metal-dependent hydrolase (beta-lactamase superfamily II)
MNHNSIKHELIACDDPAETFSFPSWTALIVHPEGNILFDAACHKESWQLPFIVQNLHMTEEDTPMSRIGQLGLKPEDINYIVLSHMHPDHHGFIDRFPNAEIIVSDDEFTNMMKLYALGKLDFGQDYTYFIEKKLNWKLLPAGFRTHELLDGVTIYNFGRGHSFGQLGLFLRMKNSPNKLLISDVIYSSDNVGPPVREPGRCMDMEAWHRHVEEVPKLAKELGAEIWYGHDLAQFETLTKSTEGCYE